MLELFFKTPREKLIFANNWPLTQNNVLIFFLKFFLSSAETVRWELLFIAQLCEYHAVWIEDLFELLNSFVIPIHCRVRVIYFLLLRRRREFANRRSMNSRKTKDECISFQISTIASRLPRLESGFGGSRVRLTLIVFIRSNWKMSLTFRRCWHVHIFTYKRLRVEFSMHLHI